MLLIPNAGAHIAVAQPEHGRMCGALGRAWGNREFGEVIPREQVCRAAEHHDDSWLDWEEQPTLDPHTGLPHTFDTAPYRVHLRIHSTWSHALAERDPYEGLIVSLHHASFFRRPGPVRGLRRGARQITAFLDDLEALQRDLYAETQAAPAEVERNRRLVRTWDGLSHDLLLGLAPRVRTGVPAATGLVDLAIARHGDVHTISPWPFATAEITVRVSGRELSGRFADEREMRRALAAAPVTELVYMIRPAVTASSDSTSDRRRA